MFPDNHKCRLPAPDPRVIIWEPKREEEDKDFVVVNIDASGATMSNMSIEVLSGGAAARAALWYLVKYVTKALLTICAALPAVMEAMRRVLLRPSVAADTGTDTRTAQHLLTRTINNLTSKTREVPASMAARMLLGAPSFTCSRSFVNLWGHRLFRAASARSCKPADNDPRLDDNQTSDSSNSSSSSDASSSFDDDSVSGSSECGVDEPATDKDDGDGVRCDDLYGVSVVGADGDVRIQDLRHLPEHLPCEDDDPRFRRLRLPALPTDLRQCR